jgi:hypothetical protein
MIWVVLLVWERFHIAHKINVDRVLSRKRSEADEVHKSKAERTWLTLWGRLNEWVSRHAVEDHEPRVSPLYQWALGFTTWVLLLPIFVTLVLVCVNPGSNFMWFTYRNTQAVKLLTILSANAYGFCDLRDGARGRFT